MIFFITGQVGRNYVFLRSILAWSIALFFWWNNRSSDFEDLGKQRIRAERNQKTN